MKILNLLASRARGACRAVGAVLLACTLGAAGPARALTQGQVVEGGFKGEYGGDVSLPAGTWQVLGAWNSDTSKASMWHVTVLQNMDPGSATPILVVRINPVAFRGNYFNCDVTAGKSTRLVAFAYGTRGSDLNNKCTELWSIGTFGEFRDSMRAREIQWWTGIFDRVPDMPAAHGAPLLLATTEYRRLNHFTLTIDTLIRPAALREPLGELVGGLKDGARSGPALQLAQWLKSQADANEKSFYEGQTRALVALASAPGQAPQAPAARQPQPAAPEVPRPRPAADDKPRPPAAAVQTAATAAAKPAGAQPPAAPVVYANRRALVIGNDSYRSVQKLANAREDARAIAEGLQGVGYQVTLQLDLDQAGMKSALRTFKQQVQGGDEVAIFYAGHGVQLGNTNYLLPIDIVGESEDQIRDDAVPLQRILDDLEERKAKFTLAMIDACRDNPFKSAGRSIGATRGLSPTTAATGQMIVFSAGSGQQALDNLGPSDKNRNSVFTRAFLKEISQPGVPVDQVIKRVRLDVVNMAKSVGHEQVPAIYDQVIGEFYFRK